jgi:hypothetical protein
MRLLRRVPSQRCDAFGAVAAACLLSGEQISRPGRQAGLDKGFRMARQHFTRFILSSEDEGMHPDEGRSNFNESMYFNLIDPQQRVGGWFRVGNRPNEGHAEMSACVYLPDGRIGFMHRKPDIGGNTAFVAAGLEFSIREAFRTQAIAYRGELCLMSNPQDMANPSRAFKENPVVPCEISLACEGVSPMHGGLRVMADGSPMPDLGFAKGHYEQHIAGSGYITVDGVRFDVTGFGLRDHSWGPRNWSSIPWYRWLPINFGRDFAMMVSIVCLPNGFALPTGMVLRDGRYSDIEAATITPAWDAQHCQKSLQIAVRSEDGDAYEIEGSVLSLIPLRHRRTGKDGKEYLTRIAEGFTEYRCNGMTGFGISEFLDQVDEAGIPLSLHTAP